MLNDDRDVLTPDELAKVLGVSQKSAYRLLHERVIGYKRIGTKYLIPKVCVLDYLNSARYTANR